jgi:hypothetical protein
MKRIKSLPTWLLLALGILALGLIGAAVGRQLGHDVPAAVALERPAFLDDASQTDLVGEKVQDEAGIAAYYKAPNQLNLELIRPLFNSIELESADYILGSISVPTYDEHYDAHVYVRRDGWIMAYYLASAPTSKMIDTTARNLDNSKLKTIMNNVAVTGGAPFGVVTYYNFNYPNATHMLLVGEYSEWFEITIPSSYSYYELSGAGDTGIRIDGTYYWSSSPHYGGIQLTSFLPDVIHTVDPGSYGALVILYRMP